MGRCGVRTAVAVYGCLWIDFVFQAEDGIRDATVTGVQTCALPICLKEWMLTANFGLMFPALAVSFILGLKQIYRSDLKYLYIVIFSVMAAFMFVYLTLEVTTVMDATGIHRNTLTYAPIILFTLTLLASRIF